MGRTHANRSARIVGHGGGTPPSPPANPVSITTVTPASGATNVAVTVSPKATFNLAMNASTISTTTVKLNNGAIAGAVTYNANNKRAIFNPTASLAGGTTYAMKVVGGGSGVKSGAGGQMTADYTWSFTTAGTAPPPPPPAGIVGYAELAGTTGGGTTVTHTINSAAPDAWQQLSDALRAGGTRYIKVTGSTVINGNGAKITVSNGNLTLDGSEWSKSLKRCHIVIKASNVIIRHMRIRPGDQMNAPDDCDGLTINPGSGNGDFLDRIAVVHCSLLWGPDVGGLTFLNGVRNATVQDSIMGAGLYLSAHFEATPALNGHSKGASTTTIGQAVEHGSNQTWYRNFITTSTDRNIHNFGVDGLDFINNVVYNWEKFPPRGNIRGGNFVSNVFKEGPDTSANRFVYISDTNASNPTIHANSVWLGSTASGGNNFCIGFAKTDNLSASARRTSVYGSLSVAAATADAALGAAVVAAAGPTVVDSIDQLLKDHYTNGTSDGFYNGQGFPAPNPSW